MTWLWANPMAHGNNIYDLAYRNGLTVEVGDRGQFYTSLNRGFWYPQETHTSRALRAVAFFQNRVVATGEAGTVVYGDFLGLTNLAAPALLTVTNLPTTDWLEGVAASSSVAVAVGDNGAVYTSPDGATWTRRAQTFTNWLRGVSFGQGLFVAVGEGGFVASSANGVTWDRRNSGTPAHLNRVAWIGNQCFVVGDNGRLLTSANGRQFSAFPAATGTTNNLLFVTGSSTYGVPTSLLVGGSAGLRLFVDRWTDETSGTKSFPAPRWSYYSGFWDGLYYVAGGTSGLLIEGFRTNLVSEVFWVSQSDSMRAWLWDVAQLGGLYLAVGDLGTIQTSPDGVTWDLELTPPSATNSVLLGVGGRPGLMVAAGSQGTLLTSSNGVGWTAVTPRPVPNDLQGIAVREGNVFVAGGAGTILSSLNGRTWNVRAQLTPSFLSGLADSPQGLVCVGENGAIFTSLDGTSWTPRSSGTTNWLSRVRFLEGLLVAVGEQGTILTSPDGVRWTPRVSGTTAWLNDVVWFSGYFYAVGNQGTVLASPTGTNWTRISIPTQKSLYGVAAGSRQLVTVGIEGVILRGQPGPLTFLDYRRSRGTNQFRLSGAPGRRFRIEGSPQLTHWTKVGAAQFLDNSGQIIVPEHRANAPPREAYRGRLEP